MATIPSRPSQRLAIHTVKTYEFNRRAVEAQLSAKSVRCYEVLSRLVDDSLLDWLPDITHSNLLPNQSESCWQKNYPELKAPGDFTRAARSVVRRMSIGERFMKAV